MLIKSSKKKIIKKKHSTLPPPDTPPRRRQTQTASDKLKDEQPPKKKKRKKRRSTLPPPDMCAHRRHAKTASKKLKNGEQLSELEIMSLFKTDFIEDENLNKIVDLFIETERSELLSDYKWADDSDIVTGYSSVWCADVESEMISYFGKHPQQLYSISPRKFEELVAAIFTNNGFAVELTPETRDGGIDIIAVHKSIFTGDSVHLIECKRYSPDRGVGIGVVQRLLGTVYQKRANKGVIVTTSFFSKDAKAVSKETENILTLRDYSDILIWLKSLRN